VRYSLSPSAMAPWFASAGRLTATIGPTQNDAAAYLVAVTGELVGALREIMARADDPGLDAVGNQRRRYVDMLACVAVFFDKIGHDEIASIGKHIGKLVVAVDDLNDGVTDPLFVTKGNKRDATRIWGARLQAVLGLECLMKTDLSPEKAADEVAKKRDYRDLARLKRGERRDFDLKKSLLSWRARFLDGRVPLPVLEREFARKRHEIDEAALSPAQYRGWARQWLLAAVTSAKR